MAMVYIFSLMYYKLCFCFEIVITLRSQVVFLYGRRSRHIIRFAAWHVIRVIDGKTYANRDVIPHQRAFFFFTIITRKNAFDDRG